eukprot:11222284-Lingulodinium_polyedra.AAC.1
MRGLHEGLREGLVAGRSRGPQGLRGCQKPGCADALAANGGHRARPRPKRACRRGNKSPGSGSVAGRR